MRLLPCSSAPAGADAADLPYFSKSYLISLTLSMDGMRGSDLKVLLAGPCRLSALPPVL